MSSNLTASATPPVFSRLVSSRLIAQIPVQQDFQPNSAPSERLDSLRFDAFSRKFYGGWDGGGLMVEGLVGRLLAAPSKALTACGNFDDRRCQRKRRNLDRWRSAD